MVCHQLMIYVTYIIIQVFMMVAFIPQSLLLGVDIINALVTSGIIYLLCQYKHYTVANVLVGIAIVFGVGTELVALTFPATFKSIHGGPGKHGLHAQISHRNTAHAGGSMIGMSTPSVSKYICRIPWQHE